MDPQTLIIWLVIGAIAGWLAGQIMTGGGFGLVGNIVRRHHRRSRCRLAVPEVLARIGGGFIGAIIHAAIGAIIVLFVVGLVKRA